MTGTYARIAWRNVFRNGRRTAIVVASVAVGVAGAIFMNLYMAGMADQMVAAAINTTLGHIQVHRAGFTDNPDAAHAMRSPGPVVAAVERLGPRAAGYAPRVIARGLAQSATNAAGVQIIGVVAARETLLTTAHERIVDGAFLTGRSTPRRREIVIGTDLSAKLGLGVGDKMVLVAQAADGEMGTGAFRVAGLFRMPAEEANEGLVFINLADAQELLALGNAISEVMVRVASEKDLAAVRDSLDADLPDRYEVRTWQDASRHMVQLVDLFDVSMIITMVIIFIAAAFGIVNTMLMAVFERMREFGILRAIGTGRWTLFRMVVYESAFIGFLGAIGGIALMAIVWAFFLRGGLDLSRFARSLAMFGSDAVIQARFRADMFVATIVLVEIMTILASVWPALRASRLLPAETIRRG